MSFAVRDDLTLGDLRKAVDRLADQDDDVPIKILLSLPGFHVNLPGSQRLSPSVEIEGTASGIRIMQAPGYIANYGPTPGIVIVGTAGG